MKKRPIILTIAGFDPSGGAGILADIKTFEQNKCCGLAVQTANTIQSEKEFIAPNWIEPDIIIKQMQTVLGDKKPNCIKVGLIPSLIFLNDILENESLKGVKVIWDPVLTTSTGFSFHHDLDILDKILDKIYMITPNWEEIKILSGMEDAKKGAEFLSKKTKVYLKGGHNKLNIGKDYLFENGIEKAFNQKKGAYYPKHGSGCVLSSALAANIARKFPLTKAILRSKRYVEYFLSSNNSLMGIHHR